MQTKELLALSSRSLWVASSNKTSPDLFDLEFLKQYIKCINKINKYYIHLYLK